MSCGNDKNKWLLAVKTVNIETLLLDSKSPQHVAKFDHGRELKWFFSGETYQWCVFCGEI